MDELDNELGMIDMMSSFWMPEHTSPRGTAIMYWNRQKIQNSHMRVNERLEPLKTNKDLTSNYKIKRKYQVRQYDFLMTRPKMANIITIHIIENKTDIPTFLCVQLAWLGPPKEEEDENTCSNWTHTPGLQAEDTNPSWT